MRPLIFREYADGRMPVALTAGGVTYYLTYDQVDSLRIVADGAGNVVKEISYDSFGNIISDSDPSFAVPLGFAGGLHDRDTGLVRFGYRDYDPVVGRWTAKDPIFFKGNDTDLYGYVSSDPINFIDPIGLINWGKVGLGAASLIGGGITAIGGGFVIAIGIAEFGTVPISGPIGLVMGIHTVAAGGVLLGAGSGLGWYGITQIWDGLFNDKISTAGSAKQKGSKIKQHFFPTTPTQPTDNNKLKHEPNEPC